MSTPYQPPHKLASMDPIWLLLGIVVLLAFLSMVALLRSGSRELLVGLLSGAWMCVLAGLAFTIWRRKELKLYKWRS